MIKIITDTTACLEPDVIQKYNISVIPQLINFGSKSYQEGIDLTITEFLSKLKSSRELPKTAAPPPELFVKIFAEYTPKAETLLCIHPSSDVSGTVRSASVAANDFPDLDIRVLDTRTIAGPLGSLVKLAATWAVEGKDPDSICAKLEQMIPKSRLFFIVETLEYLAKGGRIGGASALIGSLLQIKPILTFSNGKVDQFDKERTRKRAISRLKQLLIDQICDDEEGFPSIFHSNALEEANQISIELCEKIGIREIPVFDMPPAIVTHAGPQTIGVGFFTS